jgi:DNA-directed RNA polymerase subunit RPC12/RpoP
MATIYRCSNCKKIWHDIFDDASKLNCDCLVYPNCGEQLKEVSYDISGGNIVITPEKILQ